MESTIKTGFLLFLNPLLGLLALLLIGGEETDQNAITDNIKKYGPVFMQPCPSSHGVRAHSDESHGADLARDLAMREVDMADHAKNAGVKTSPWPNLVDNERSGIWG